MLTVSGNNVLCTGRALELASPRLALFQPIIQVQRTDSGRQVAAMVVGSQQLENTRGEGVRIEE